MALTHTNLQGFVPAVVTPFTTAGEIMTDAFRALIEHFIDLGAQAICVAGDNGESWTLTQAERRQLTKLAVEQAAGRVPVISGVSAALTSQSLAYARDTRDAGASAVLAMPQTYVLKASRNELLQRFEALSTVDIPVVLYNSPRRSGIELSLSDLDALLGVAPIIGIKESHRDFFHLTHLIERFRERIAIMIGPSHYIIPGLALGAAGFIATGPELLGPTAGTLCRLASAAPSPQLADIHFRLTRLYELLMSTGTWPSSLKAALNLRGLQCGVPREPVLPLAGEELRTFASKLAELCAPEKLSAQ